MKRLIASELLNLSEWPRVSVEDMDESKALITQRRVDAIKKYVSGVSISEITASCKITKTKLLRLFSRCIIIHEDGRIWGFRACRWYAHTKKYRRKAKSLAGKMRATAGHSGLLRALFDRFPHILEDLLERALESKGRTFSESGLRLDRLHARFIDLCRASGIETHEYPFSVDLLAERSLRTVLCKELYKQNTRRAVAARFGDEAAAKLSGVGESPRIGKRDLPYERVEFDGHRLDIHLILEIEDPLGGEPVILQLERIWLLVAQDKCSRAILGYHICLNRNYAAEDVLTCLENSIIPWRKRELTIPGLIYAPGAGLPSGLITESAYAKWGELAFDNAKSHLAQWVLERVEKCIGCIINPGPVKTPESRQFVERFFRTFEELGFQRLPSTAGSHVKDPRRRSPEDKAHKYRVRLEEVCELVDVLIANYNISPTMALHGRSPLEYLRYSFDRKSFFVRSVPPDERPNFSLTRKIKKVRVRGDLSKGLRPFVQIIGVRYYGEKLNMAVGLIGAVLHIEIETKDLRRVRAFLENGDEFDVLHAARAWAGTAHDLQTRLLILRYARTQRLQVRHMPDAVEAYIAAKKAERKTSKKDNNRLARTLMGKNSRVASNKETFVVVPVGLNVMATDEKARELKIVKQLDDSPKCILDGAIVSSGELPIKMVKSIPIGNFRPKLKLMKTAFNY